MFGDFDRSLREMGTGDLSVGRQIKRMAEAFYGRVQAYEEGLAGADPLLKQALSRNLFRREGGPEPGCGPTTVGGSSTAGSMGSGK